MRKFLVGGCPDTVLSTLLTALQVQAPRGRSARSNHTDVQLLTVSRGSRRLKTRQYAWTLVVAVMRDRYGLHMCSQQSYDASHGNGRTSVDLHCKVPSTWGSKLRGDSQGAIIYNGAVSGGYTFLCPICKKNCFLHFHVTNPDLSPCLHDFLVSVFSALLQPPK